MSWGEQRKCPDCGGVFFVEDHANGDIVCRTCGLVVQAHVIDERSEWRTFSDKDKESVDPNRVGGPSNPLLEGGGLSTVIGKTQGDGGTSYMLNRLHARSNNPDRHLSKAFKQIGQLCEALNLVKSVENRACETFKEVSDTGKLKGKNNMSICAACVYLAARQDNNPRTFKEITSVMPSDISKKDIGKTFKDIVEVLKEKGAEAVGANDAAANNAAQRFVGQAKADHMRRYTNELRLGHDIFKVCRDTFDMSKQVSNGRSVLKGWEGKSPNSVAAAIIWAIVQLAQVKQNLSEPLVSMQNLVLVTGVAEVTIRASYKDLYDDLPLLLPDGWKDKELLKKGLSAPS